MTTNPYLKTTPCNAPVYEQHGATLTILGKNQDAFIVDFDKRTVTIGTCRKCRKPHTLVVDGALQAV